jgi:3-oxoacyl-[acyl-carrier protein] reductase
MMNGAPMIVDLAGRTAIVTGAASGIGLACAQLLAKSGAAVVFADRNVPGAESAAAEAAASGGTAIAIGVEISSSAEVDALVEATTARFGQVDILVHCAGGGVPRGDVVDTTDEVWHQAVGVNLDGTFYVTRAVARKMLPRRRGTMVLITSDRGVLGDKSRAAYAASKGGMIALVKTLAIELGAHGITVNGLNPGTTSTPATAKMDPALRERRLKTDPLGKMSETSEVAQIVLYLAGPASAFTTGQIITTRMRET